MSIYNEDYIPKVLQPDSGVGSTPVDKNKSFWILWCPSYPAPPKVRFNTLEQAQKVAKEMAQRNGTQFYVLKAVSLSERALPPVKTTKLK